MGPFRWLFGAAMWAAAATLVLPAWAQESSGLSVPVKSSDDPSAVVVDQVKLYEASYALVIGIDLYTSGWPRLSNAVRDAEAIKAELLRQGFQVELLANPDSDRLDRTLREFFVVKGANPEARLFIWFSGHGYTEAGEGFIVPADAPRADAGPGFKLKAFSMRRFGEYVRLAKAKHVLSVLDACFAGTVFDAQRDLPPRAITMATRLPVRQFLSSGDADQQVLDNGAFRDLFIRAIRGEETADANRDGYVTGTEIGMFLTDRVTNLTRSRQTPRYGKLLDKDYDRGDFVFQVMPAETKVAMPASSPATRSLDGGAAGRPAVPNPSSITADERAMDLTFWQSIQQSRNRSDFEAYLSRFPEGTFAPLAKTRLNELKRDSAPPAAATAPATAPTVATAVPPPPPGPKPAAAAPVPYRAPALGTKFHISSGGYYEVVSVEGVDVNLRNASGKTFSIINCCFFVDDRIFDRAAWQSLWPLTIGKEVTSKITQPKSGEEWTVTARVVRSEKIQVANRAVDTIVIDIELKGLGANKHHSVTANWYAPELGFPVKRSRELRSGSDTFVPWEVVRIETPPERPRQAQQAAAPAPTPESPVTYRAPALGTKFHLNSGGYLEVLAVDGFKLNLKNALGNELTFFECCYFPGPLTVEPGAFEKLWPLAVGKAITAKVSNTKTAEDWELKIRIVRREKVEAAGRSFDTFLMEVDLQGLGKNKHHSIANNWFAPEVGFPVKREVQLLSGTGTFTPWVLTRIEPPAKAAR